MKVTLKGKPISVNKLYRGRRFLTPEGKSLKEDYYYQTKQQYKGKPFTTDIKLMVHIYFANKMSDIDNCLKAILDSMSGLLWNDDRQIIELHVYKKIDKEDPRVELDML